MAERKSDFNPTRSAVKAETIVEFLQKDLQHTSLIEVPGVGKAMLQDLKEQGIETPIQLLGKFLSMHCFDGLTCDNFFEYIRSVNSRANAHTIVFSMASYADNKGVLQYELVDVDM